MKGNRKKQQKMQRYILFTLLSFGAILLLSPIWWMASTSLKSMSEIMQYPPTFWQMNFTSRTIYIHGKQLILLAIR